MHKQDTVVAVVSYLKLYTFSKLKVYNFR